MFVYRLVVIVFVKDRGVLISFLDGKIIGS